MTKAAWIAIDWGTSHLRAWAMDATGRDLAEATSNQGMGTLAPSDFEPALLALVEPWLDGPTLAVACGMVGARQGWAEAPYARVPAPPSGAAGLKVAPTNDPRLAVHIIPGLSQSKPADVMRGEETQIAGFLNLNPGWDGVICLPGTHTKWAHISAGEVVSFQTFMSGELFSLLSTASVLRHSIPEEGWSAESFESALNDAIAKPELLAARLFALRAESLVSTLDGSSARARLSGLLIGAELAAARPYWLGQQVAVIGGAQICAPYITALSLQGVPATQVDAKSATLAGLRAAYTTLGETV